MLDKLLKERALPPLLTQADGTPVTDWRTCRAVLLTALETYSYGHTPPPPLRVWCEELEAPAPFRRIYGGKVRQERLLLHFETEHGVCRFPFVLALPLRVEKPPVLLHLAFRPDLPDKAVPVEEITDAGYALAVVCYQDMVNDAHFGDFSDGIAAHFGTQNPRGPEEWGKIGMWAYGASRVLDYLLTRADIDAAHTAVVGHSRLGKTALWCAAQDERFWAAVSNDSGYGGAATSKHGTGERVQDFVRVGSWDWFCENFKLFADEKEDEKPYDQSWLLAMIAPRLLCVGSAVEDWAADPQSEFLTTLEASQVWERLGVPGLITPDRLPEAGDVLQDGHISYHMRFGDHFLSREDWNNYIRFFDRHLGRGRS